MEIWRDIYFEENEEVYDYRELYQILNKGKVKSLNYNHTGKEQILKEEKHKSGYLRAKLYKDGKGKMFRIHRLVAHLFIENNDPSNKTQVNHIDEDKTNNSVENLEWMTAKENINHGTRNEKASEKMKGENHPMFGRTGENNPNSKKIICLNTGKIYPSSLEAERQTGVAHSSIIKCCRGKLKSAGKSETGERLIWKYYEED